MVFKLVLKSYFCPHPAGQNRRANFCLSIKYLKERLFTVAIIAALCILPTAQGTTCKEEPRYTGDTDVNKVECRSNYIYQWTVAEYCCFGEYDWYKRNPLCCSSDQYYSVITGIIIASGVIGALILVCTSWIWKLPRRVICTCFACVIITLDNVLDMPSAIDKPDRPTINLSAPIVMTVHDEECCIVEIVDTSNLESEGDKIVENSNAECSVEEKAAPIKEESGIEEMAAPTSEELIQEFDDEFK